MTRPSMPDAARSLYANEMAAARTTTDPATAWRHLERAHIVSQPWAWPHTCNHAAMLAFALRQRDRQEALGQLLRLTPASPAGRSPGPDHDRLARRRRTRLAHRPLPRRQHQTSNRGAHPTHAHPGRPRQRALALNRPGRQPGPTTTVTSRTPPTGRGQLRPRHPDNYARQNHAGRRVRQGQTGASSSNCRSSPRASTCRRRRCARRRRLEDILPATASAPGTWPAWRARPAGARGSCSARTSSVHRPAARPVAHRGAGVHFLSSQLPARPGSRAVARWYSRPRGSVERLGAGN